LNLGNFAHGIYVSGGSSNVLIGGTTSGAANVIGFNSNDGVAVLDTSVVSILGNRIFNNGSNGIDLGLNGVTPNDSGDSDSGPNGLQNFPVLTSATRVGADTRILGSLQSEAIRSYRLEFFSSPSADPTGFGEGRQFLGAIRVTTDASGIASFDTSLVGVAVADGHVVSATATEEPVLGVFGATSEFSQVVSAAVPTAGVSIVALDGLTSTEAGAALRFSATLQSMPSDDVTFSLMLSHPGEGVLSVATVTFTPSNWNVAQEFIVTGRDDLIVDGNRAYVLLT
jgi:hypothetical protein